MNRIANRIRAFAGALAFLLLFLALPGCRRDDGENDSGIPVLQADAEGNAVLTASLDSSVLHTHAGQAARLYALSPGETTAQLAGKTPLDEQEVSSRLRFSFPMTEENLYDTYAVVFSDGTLLSGTPVSLSNPEVLAADSTPFPHDNSYKGLYVGDEELSRSLYSTHTVVKIDLSALTAGSGFQTSLGGITLELDGVLLSHYDAQVAAADAAGMQVSLEILPDPALQFAEYAALFDLLTARYEAVTALLIGELPTEPAGGTSSAATTAGGNAKEDSGGAENISENPDGDGDGDRDGTAASPTTIATAAELYRLAYLALVSRRAQGRVYLTASGTDAPSYLLAVAEQVALSASYPFGAALSPAPATALTASDDESGGTNTSGSGAPSTSGNGDTSAFLLSDLVPTVQSLRLSLGRSFRFCVAGVEFPAADPSLQAALMTYCYRAAVNTNADFVILGAQSGENTGLYDENMTPRVAARVFAGLDSGENAEGETFAAELLGEEWNTLAPGRPNRLAVEDAANLGTADDPGKRWMEFSGTAGEDFPIFSLVGAGSAPEAVESSVWGTPVLSASLLPSLCPDGSGYRCTLSSADDLAQVYVLSARLMLQSPATSCARITLRLDGTAADGRALSCRASVTLSCNEWQEVSFHIRGFTSQMDASAPCTLTFSMLPVSDASERGADIGAQTMQSNTTVDAFSGASDAPYALLLHSLNLRTAAPDYTVLWVVLLVLGGFGIGFLAVYLPARRRRRRMR